MIAVFLGTHAQPFVRAVDLVLGLVPAGPVLVQHGHTPSRPAPGVRWVAFMPHGEVVRTMAAAELVVTHCGVGSVLTALGVGRRPVVLPRLSRLGEHVDDHQLQLAERLAAEGLVEVCAPGSSLTECVRRAGRIAAPRTGSGAALGEAVWRAAGLPGATGARR